MKNIFKYFQNKDILGPGYLCRSRLRFTGGPIMVDHKAERSLRLSAKCKAGSSLLSLPLYSIFYSIRLLFSSNYFNVDLPRIIVFGNKGCKRRRRRLTQKGRQNLMSRAFILSHPLSTNKSLPFFLAFYYLWLESGSRGVAHVAISPRRNVK